MKRDNHGFSLVELIVVVLIMAIVAVALAPQVMKWVENSRIATDMENRTNIENNCMLAIANEAVFDKVKDGSYEIKIVRSISDGDYFIYEDDSGSYDTRLGNRPDDEDVFWERFLAIGGFDEFEDFEEAVAIKTTPAGEDIILDVHVYEGGYTFSELKGTVTGDINISN